MNKVLVIAPHPDDETLGCGGSLFKHELNKDDVSWLIVTEINTSQGFSALEVENRDSEIHKVSQEYGFINTYNLRLPTTKLDPIPFTKIVNKISDLFKKIRPELIYIPFVYDVHSDHQIISKAIQSNLKWFRHDYIKKVMMYETLSETEFGFLEKKPFNPNIFVDITEFLEKKINVMNIYKNEMGAFPFPRSEKTIRSLASLRGSQSGFNAAEAFELVFERQS